MRSDWTQERNERKRKKKKHKNDNKIIRFPKENTFFRI